MSDGNSPVSYQPHCIPTLQRIGCNYPQYLKGTLLSFRMLQSGHYTYNLPAKDQHNPLEGHTERQKTQECRNRFHFDMFHRFYIQRHNKGLKFRVLILQFGTEYLFFDGYCFSFHQLDIPVQVPLLHNIKLLGHFFVFEHEMAWQPLFQGSPSNISGHLHVGLPFSLTHSALILQ